MSEYTSPKPNARSINYKDANKREAFERRRNILYLVASYLYDINLGGAASTLEKEAQLANQYQVCDNVDLDIILQEYQSYYFTKFQRQPKILRKLSETEKSIKKAQGSTRLNSSNNKLKVKKSDEKTDVLQHNSGESSESKFDFEIISIGPNATPKIDDSLIHYGDTNQVATIYDFQGYPTEWKELAEPILKEFVSKDLGISWNNCIGLEPTIELLKEATIYPVIYPNLFKNIPAWKGVLLFGPPGTGKTLLAQALACESPGKFINVTSSTFISKWRGESEKMIKVLFEIAKYYAPTTIFIDELDAVAASNIEHDHEASRRFKSELLIQIDGILKSEEPVFVLATTNYPWKLDLALLRRFEKRILVPLPNEEMRTKLLKYYLNIHSSNARHIDKDNVEHLAIITKNYSGSDIKLICQEAAMMVVREKLEEMKGTKFSKCDNNLRPIMLKDLKQAICRIKPCVDINTVQKYVEWNAKFGSL